MAKLILLNMPIGNTSDLTARVSAALSEGSNFAVEDTRSFREFLARTGLSQEGKRIHSLHDYSSAEKMQRLLDVVVNGEDLFVCSEAGSPVLSDPAFPLVRMAHEQAVEVETYSGISAITAALELSGLPALPFSFHGFLPREDGKIREAFRQLGAGTHVFFESPLRIKDTLRLAAMEWPSAWMAVVKEISKPFQKVVRFQGETVEAALQDVVEKGEFVWLVHFPEDPRPRIPVSLQKAANEILTNGGGNKALSKLLSEVLDRPAKDIYAELSHQRD